MRISLFEENKLIAEDLDAEFFNLPRRGRLDSIKVVRISNTGHKSEFLPLNKYFHFRFIGDADEFASICRADGSLLSPLCENPIYFEDYYSDGFCKIVLLLR